MTSYYRKLLMAFGLVLLIGIPGHVWGSFSDSSEEGDGVKDPTAGTETIVLEEKEQEQEEKLFSFSKEFDSQELKDICAFLDETVPTADKNLRAELGTAEELLKETDAKLTVSVDEFEKFIAPYLEQFSTSEAHEENIKLKYDLPGNWGGLKEEEKKGGSVSTKESEAIYKLRNTVGLQHIQQASPHHLHCFEISLMSLCNKLRLLARADKEIFGLGEKSNFHSVVNTFEQMILAARKGIQAFWLGEQWLVRRWAYQNREEEPSKKEENKGRYASFAQGWCVKAQNRLADTLAVLSMQLARKAVTYLSAELAVRGWTIQVIQNAIKSNDALNERLYGVMALYNEKGLEGGIFKVAEPDAKNAFVEGDPLAFLEALEGNFAPLTSSTTNSMRGDLLQEADGRLTHSSEAFFGGETSKQAYSEGWKKARAEVFPETYEAEKTENLFEKVTQAWDRPDFSEITDTTQEEDSKALDAVVHQFAEESQMIQSSTICPSAMSHAQQFVNCGNTFDMASRLWVMVSQSYLAVDSSDTELKQRLLKFYIQVRGIVFEAARNLVASSKVLSLFLPTHDWDKEYKALMQSKDVFQQYLFGDHANGLRNFYPSRGTKGAFEGLMAYTRGLKKLVSMLPQQNMKLVTSMSFLGHNLAEDPSKITASWEGLQRSRRNGKERLDGNKPFDNESDALGPFVVGIIQNHNELAQNSKYNGTIPMQRLSQEFAFFLQAAGLYNLLSQSFVYEQVFGIEQRLKEGLGKLVIEEQTSEGLALGIVRESKKLLFTMGQRFYTQVVILSQSN